MTEQSQQSCTPILYDVFIKIHGYGQIQLKCTRENVRQECEDYIKYYTKNNKENAKITIDVSNRETGEVRRIWQNQNQTFLQFPTGQSPYMKGQ